MFIVFNVITFVDEISIKLFWKPIIPWHIRYNLIRGSNVLEYFLNYHLVKIFAMNFMTEYDHFLMIPFILPFSIVLVKISSHFDKFYEKMMIIACTILTIIVTAYDVIYNNYNIDYIIMISFTSYFNMLANILIT